LAFRLGKNFWQTIQTVAADSIRHADLSDCLAMKFSDTSRNGWRGFGLKERRTPIRRADEMLMGLGFTTLHGHPVMR
jgi:hypothetical protein